MFYALYLFMSSLLVEYKFHIFWGQNWYCIWYTGCMVCAVQKRKLPLPIQSATNNAHGTVRNQLRICNQDSPAPDVIKVTKVPTTNNWSTLWQKRSLLQERNHHSYQTCKNQSYCELSKGGGTSSAYNTAA